MGLYGLCCIMHHDSAPVVILLVVTRCQFVSFVCMCVSRTVRVSVGNACQLYPTAYTLYIPTPVWFSLLRYASLNLPPQRY
ncbi:hypothetical protein V8E52_009529 [Russula decolorans]